MIVRLLYRQSNRVNNEMCALFSIITHQGQHASSRRGPEVLQYTYTRLVPYHHGYMTLTFYLQYLITSISHQHVEMCSQISYAHRWRIWLYRSGNIYADCINSAGYDSAVMSYRDTNIVILLEAWLLLQIVRLCLLAQIRLPIFCTFIFSCAGLSSESLTRG